MDIDCAARKKRNVTDGVDGGRGRKEGLRWKTGVPRKERSEDTVGFQGISGTNR